MAMIDAPSHERSSGEAGGGPLRAFAHHPRLRMLAGAGIVMAIFVLSNAPTPLYSRWQAQLGFSWSTLTALFSTYIVGVLLALAISGQCSDRFGCRAVLVPGIAAGMVACFLFTTADSVGALLLARFVSGVSVAVAITAGVAALAELGGAGEQRTAALLASTAIVLGAGLGPLLAGGLALALPEPTGAVFSTELLVLGGVGVLALALPFVPRARGSRAWRLHLPSIPRRNRTHLALGIAALGCAMSGTAFVLSLGPSVLAHLTGVDSPLVAGAMACAMFTAATVAQLPARKVPVRVVFSLSVAAIIMGMASVAVAVAARLASALLVGAICAGAGHGLAQLAGLTLITLHVAEDRRAEATAVLNIGGYVPCGATPVLTGLLIDRTSLALGTAALSLFITAVAAAVWLFVRRALPLIPPVCGPMRRGSVR